MYYGIGFLDFFLRALVSFLIVAIATMIAGTSFLYILNMIRTPYIYA